jgi:hypothetical protein
LPEGWHASAQAAWLRGERQAAIDELLAILNQQGDAKVLPLVHQLAYYVFLCGDPAAAARFLEEARQQHPRDPQLLLNLAVCLSRSGQLAPALARIREYLEMRPDDAVAHDSLCATLYRLGRLQDASEAGTRALVLKDKALPRPQRWSLPAGHPRDYLQAIGKRNVVAFSLWGSKQPYLRGALDNALAASRIYPGWIFVFFVDETVPQPVRAQLQELGAEVRVEAPGQSDRLRLAWRFQVANDPAVGRFLVRDVDSVVTQREREAVDAWLASERWFHVMRDWWTHTDVMLAGMWGGVAGVLPDLRASLEGYRPDTMETPNIDQWFLRDRVWPYVRLSCLVHDRCFTPPGAQPWPLPPPEGAVHVGQDEFATRRHEQEARLAHLPGTDWRR